MRVIKDFKCNSCEEEFEALVENLNKHTTCPDCGSELAKVFYKSMNFQLDGTDEGFPTAYNKWADRHERGGKLR